MPTADAELQIALELSRQEFERQRSSQPEDREPNNLHQGPAAEVERETRATVEGTAAPAAVPNPGSEENGDTIPDSEDEGLVNLATPEADNATAGEDRTEVFRPTEEERSQTHKSTNNDGSDDDESASSEEDSDVSEDDYEESSDEELKGKGKKVPSKPVPPTTRNVSKRNEAKVSVRSQRTSVATSNVQGQHVLLVNISTQICYSTPASVASKENKPVLTSQQASAGQQAKKVVCAPAPSQYSGAIVASLPPKAGMMRNGSSLNFGGGVRLPNNAGVRRPGLSRSSRILPLHARPQV
eukprot:768637-Hanusia_phi.AAC.11